MRIVHEINLGHFKCTLFHYQEKYSLKIEDQFGEVHYKLGQVSDFPIDQLDKLLRVPNIQKSIQESFLAMRHGRDHLKSILSEEGDEDEEII